MLDVQHLFQQTDLADVDLFITLDVSGSSASVPMEVDGEREAVVDAVLQRFPAHKAILDASAYFRAQRYGDKDVPAGTRHTTYLVLDTADMMPAAEAVLGYMYGVTSQFRQLSHAQLVSVVQLADMMQVRELLQAAVDKLTTAAASSEGLSEAAQKKLLSLPAWPACLLSAFDELTCTMPAEDVAALWLNVSAPQTAGSSHLPGAGQQHDGTQHSSYVEERLLRAFGDMTSPKLFEKRAKLPTRALALLLAWDKLQLYGEDAVLITVMQHYDLLHTRHEKEAAIQLLEPLIRCPYLSPTGLAMVATGTVASQRLAATAGRTRSPSGKPMLQPLQLESSLPSGHVLKLTAFLQVERSQRIGGVHGMRGSFNSTEFKQLVPDAPSSWGRGCRLLQPTPSSFTLQWSPPVAKLRDMCARAWSTRKTQVLCSPEGDSVFHSGCTWSISILCSASDKGSTMLVGLRTQSPFKPLLTHFTAISVAVGIMQVHTPSPVSSFSSTINLISVGPMKKGWDAAAASKAGLPAAGDVKVAMIIAPCMCYFSSVSVPAFSFNAQHSVLSTGQ